VYYEYMLLDRAGLMTRDAVLDRLGSTVAVYENAPGRRRQSAALAGIDTWTGFFGRNEHAAAATLSYYDIGCGLSLLLDLRIRAASAGRASLDDVMRALYRTYYKEKKRGFTAGELREACEKAAGAPLGEIFDTYARTTEPWDYAKYLAPAGLAIDLEPKPAAEPWFGASTQDQNGGPAVASVELDSPASLAGLCAQDEILAIDGARVTARSFPGTIAAHKPGERIRVLYARRGRTAETEVVLGLKKAPAYRITPVKDSSASQKELLDAWLK
jgi:predicted metalloprotease with PDZ domain